MHNSNKSLGQNTEILQNSTAKQRKVRLHGRVKTSSQRGKRRVRICYGRERERERCLNENVINMSNTAEK